MYAQYILEAGGNELQGQNIDYFKRKCNFMINKHNSYIQYVRKKSIPSDWMCLPYILYIF